MSEQKIKITAESIEQFQKIDKIISQLPNKVKDGIASADEKFSTVLFTLKCRYSDTVAINVTDNVTEISGSDKGVSVLCGSIKFVYPYEIKGGFVINFY